MVSGLVGERLFLAVLNPNTLELPMMDRKATRTPDFMVDGIFFDDDSLLDDSMVVGKHTS